MPTYEYACKSCGDHLEVVQSFKDEALTVCPACGGPLRKVFGSIGITFKGSGFYKTDSRAGSSKSDKSDAKTASKLESKSESKAETKSDSKPEKKPESKKSEPKSAAAS
jgi:putative FmdB family regulatory protein